MLAGGRGPCKPSIFQPPATLLGAKEAGLDLGGVARAKHRVPRAALELGGFVAEVADTNTGAGTLSAGRWQPDDDALTTRLLDTCLLAARARTRTRARGRGAPTVRACAT